jgi:hypothetical protein
VEIDTEDKRLFLCRLLLVRPEGIGFNTEDRLLIAILFRRFSMPSRRVDFRAMHDVVVS